MKNISRSFWLSGALFALVASASAQIVEFRATINAAQEVPTNPSAATGSAIMIYDVASNTFDLVVSISNFPATLASSHIHEGASGVNGPVVTNFGGEAVYTRNGSTLTATFRGVTHGGTKLTLLKNGAYVNFHSSAFPGGEVRGQLIAQPKRLVANFTVAQEQAAFPAATLTGNTNAFGAAVMTYDSGTNVVNLRISLYNFPNTLTNSHFHEGAPGVSGAVVQNLGAGTVVNYARDGNSITGTFLNLTYGGDPVKLLTGGAYLNFHSNVFAGGECRGQVIASEELPGTRVANVSTRGFVGTGSQVLIGGFNITGSEPVRMLITAKGPSLSTYGVTGVLANPTLTIFDGSGRQMAQNDDVGTPAAGTELATIYGVPTSTLESALIVVLPPGNYTAIVAGSGGTFGIALLEATDLRNNATILSNRAAGATGAEGDVLAEFKRDLRAAATNLRWAAAKPTGRPEPELCVGVPLGVQAPAALAQAQAR
ncbi:MAG: CHRD domain-containing protein [Undibacterium sp.]|nr:CHRD domain-containing protein [Opitutaceae bacterium]